MVQKIQMAFSVLLFILMTVSCGQGKANQTVASNEVLSEVEAVHPGELPYKKNCMSCHQKDLGGIPRMYPPLANNKTVSGNKEALIGIVLNGMTGEIEVNGIPYNGIMASYSNLSDQDIANILNYIRANHGNSGDEILPADVRKLR